MSADWINLPETSWIKIIQLLDVTSLLRTSETCKTINYIVANSILTHKLKLVVDFQLKGQLSIVAIEDLSKVVRNYSTLVFRNFKTTKRRRNFIALCQVAKMMSHCIREIHFENFSVMTFLQWDFLVFQMKKVGMFNIICNIAIRYDLFENMNLLDNVNVRRFHASGVLKTHYEQFLLKHKELKYLRSDGYNAFDNDNLSKVTFSLQKLCLYHVPWYNKDYALHFIRTQTHLRKVSIKLNYDQYDHLFLKHIINNNPNLDDLLIELHECDERLQNHLHAIEVNTSVTQFYFRCFPENPILSFRLNRLFPNNKSYPDFYDVRKTSLLF